jgi:hypothetical protein
LRLEWIIKVIRGISWRVPRDARAQPSECGSLSFSSIRGCGCSELLGRPVTQKAVRLIYTDGPRHLIIGHGWRCRFHRTLKFAVNGRAAGRSRFKEREGSLWAQGKESKCAHRVPVAVPPFSLDVSTYGTELRLGPMHLGRCRRNG